MSEYRALAEAAGTIHLIQPSGWVKIFRNAATQDKETRDVERWQRGYGITFEALDPTRSCTAEPHLDTSLLDGPCYAEADSMSDPSALVTTYTKHFEQLGDRLFEADANTLTPDAP